MKFSGRIHVFCLFYKDVEMCVCVREREGDVQWKKGKEWEACAFLAAGEHVHVRLPALD